MNTLAKFKIKKTNLFINFDAEAEFEDVLAEFVEKLAEAKKIFKNEKTSIFFTGRELNETEEEAIYTAMEESNLNIVVYGDEAYIEPSVIDAPKDIKEETNESSEIDSENPTNSTPKELTFSEESVSEKAKDLEQEYDPQRQVTFYQNGSMRSGKRIEFDGSVVLLGDLNAGAEIIASGNIVILGACRGMVHAGCKGDSNAYIFAQQLTPTQIRISEMVTYLSTDKNGIHYPSYAYIEDGKIYVAKI